MIRVAALAVAIVLVTATGCGEGGESPDEPTGDSGIRVASFDFAESVLLAEMYAQVIESSGTPVVRLGPVGPREVVAPALELGHIDVVPEYLGTALSHAGAPVPNADTASARDDLVERLAPRGLTALDAAAAEDKNVIVVAAETAASADLRSVSDLGPLAADLVFGGPPECPDRPLCLAGLEDVYSLHFGEFVPQASQRFTAEALRRGEIDVAVMFSTDAALATFDLVVLDDDRGLQPAENVLPVIRVEALRRWGRPVADALNELSDALTTRELRILNVLVDQDGVVEDVARAWLEARELVGTA